MAKKQKSAENVLLLAPTLDKILESELTNNPEIKNISDNIYVTTTLSISPFGLHPESIYQKIN